MKRSGKAGGIGAMPRDADALHTWLVNVLGVSIPRRALGTAHDAPFSYLVHSFFEGTAGTAAMRSPRDGLSADCIVWAGRGGGKTFLGAIATTLDLIFKPGVEVRILAGSLEQASRMYRYLRSFFEVDRLRSLIDGRMTERRIRLTNGSSLELLSQSQASVRGTRVQKLRCDEVDLFDPEVWEAAQLVTRSKQCGGVWVTGTVECLSTMHRPHGIVQRLVEAADRDGRRVFRWNLLDVLGSCAGNAKCEARLECGSGECALGPECSGRALKRGADDLGHISLDDALRMKARVSNDTWQTEMLCRKPRRSHCVFPEFDPERHVVDSLPTNVEGWRWFAGMDFGFRAPTVVLYAGVDQAGTIWIAEERVQSEVLLRVHAEAIANWRHKVEFVGADPAGSQHSSHTGQSDFGVLGEYGLVVRAKRLRTVTDGIALVRARLDPAGEGAGLKIVRNCRSLIESLTKYHYAESGNSSEPVKDGSDHAADALRYLVTNLDCPYKSGSEQYSFRGIR